MKILHLSLLREIASHGAEGMTVKGRDIVVARSLSREGLVSYDRGKYTITYLGRKMLTN